MAKQHSEDKNFLISVAPMMDWTDRHCRYFHRLLSPNARLYKEMVTSWALIHGDKDRHLRFNEQEQPVALQLGGNNPKDLARCAGFGQLYGYNEINLNCGCPSNRVQNGAFGAVLMKEPELVAKCYKAMAETVDIPVTIKCRIGVDNSEDFAFLDHFISAIAAQGCRIFIIHARKAWLKGLSPKENREVPPLRHDIVRQLKQKYPELTIIMNGGIRTTEEVAEHLQDLDGVMIGREAYSNPIFLSELENRFFNTDHDPDLGDVISKMADYADDQRVSYGVPLKSITRHMIGLFQGQKGAKYWRQSISNIPKMPADQATGIALRQIYDSMQQVYRAQA